MKIKNLQMKKALRTVLFVLLLCAAGMTKAQTENITFADANVKAICVANWDTDGDGELNQTEAAAVTSLDGVFMFDDGITSFDELLFFTGLTSFGEDEFNSCTSLVAISIPSAVTSIGNYAFSDCNSLTSMTLFACTPPALGSHVFDNVPSAVVVVVPCHTSTLYQAVEGWSDFTNYGEFEFGVCPISFDDANVKALCLAHWDTNGDGELSYDEAAAVTDLGNYFRSTAITSFDELEFFIGLASIPNTAFYGCTSLASVTLPSSVTALGNGSFYNCTSLTTVNVYAETPPTVGTNAFRNVPTDMVVYVPCGTYSVYLDANDWNEFPNLQEFGSCLIEFADANVKALCVANWDTDGDGELSCAEAAAVTDLGEVFRQNYSITSFNELQYFTGLTFIGYYSFEYCGNLTSIVIPNSATSIGDNAFYGCASLTSIEIPNSVISIADNAFYGCGSLTSIEIPNSVVSLGTNPFAGCFGLEQIIVDSENVYYDSRENCNAIINTSSNELVTGCKNSVILSFVTSIGNYAFYGCSSLASIEISNSVTSIGDYAFYGCSGLTAMTVLADNPPLLGSIYYVFYSVNKSIPVYVPCESEEAYTAMNWGGFNNIMGMCAGEIIATTNPAEGGTITGGGAYEGGATCILTATANHGYRFSNWTENGEMVSSDAEYTFMVTGDRNLVANFIAIPPAPVVAEYYPDPDKPSSPYVKVHWDEVPLAFEAQIGEGTNTSTYFPFHTLYNYSISENLFLASELLEAGVTSSPMTSLSWYVNSATCITPQNDISIWMANVSDTELTTTSHTTAGMTLVYTGDNVLPLAGQWNEFVFNQGNFSWDGHSNVLIVCQRLNGSWQGSISWQTHNPGFNAMSYHYGDNVVYDMNSQTYTMHTSNTNRPNIIMKASWSNTNTYNIYRANCSGANTQLIAENLSDTQYIDEDWGQLESGVYKYGVSVADSTNTEIFWSNCIYQTPPAPVVAEYYPDPNESNSPYVKVHWAATSFEAQIGEGTSTFGYFPFYTLYNYSISENLFLASELEEAGVNTATMTSLSWYATNAPGYEQQGISIWMANVSDTELTTTSHTVSGMTLVYTGTVTPEIGWNEFVFNEGTFVWDGVSNVLILCQRNNGVWNSTVYWQSQNVGFNASSYRYQDSEPYNVNIANTVYNSNQRPNIIMKGEGAMTYNLYRANCDGTNAQLIAENVSDLQYIDETWWQLENNSYKYGVSVADSTSTDIFWSNCIENNFIPTAFHFITPGNWSNAANWQYGALPGVYDIVFIDANCQLDMTTEVAELTVSNGQSLTIQPDKTLTVTGDLTNTSTTGLVIKDGAQLINASGNVAATMEKVIASYSNSNPDAWYTIASPMNEMPIEGSSFSTPEFDLYRFNESNLTNEEWENYKGGLADFTTFENGRGYLFANSNAFSPAFTGTLNASAVSCSLSYTERPNDPLSGFNLIGNPFPHDIYKGAGVAIDDANLASGYYTLTNEGTWQVHTFEDAIHPGQGILVKATAPTVLTIAKSTAVATAETGGAKKETSPLSINVKGENGMDQAFVYFGHGNSMEKLDGFVAQEPSLWVRDNDKDYAIAHMEKACETLELCFSSKQSGDFILTIDRNETEFEYLQLVDHVTGLTVDLLKQPTYGFHVTGQEPDARFSIRFKVTE